MLDIEDMLITQFSEDGSGPVFYNCWSYCREIARRAGQVLPTFSDGVAELSIRDNTMRGFLKSDFVSISEPEPFCIITFRLGPKFINHCGIVLEDVKHFTQISRIGPCVERLDDSKWMKRFEGFYRYVKYNQNRQPI